MRKRHAVVGTFGTEGRRVVSLFLMSPSYNIKKNIFKCRIQFWGCSFKKAEPVEGFFYTLFLYTDDVGAYLILYYNDKYFI
jgi:hypothetical protein